MIRCVVGLGNPGPEYKNTRHNVGFRVLDLLTEQNGGKWKKRWWQNYWLAEIKNPVNLFCCKPATFMNLSGRAVYKIAKKYKLAPEELLVVYDDTHLPLGKLRARTGGSSGGHNGLQSIINYLETDKIPRLRLGIGEGKSNRINHVLSDFDKCEIETAEKMISKAADAIILLKTMPWDIAVQQINSK